MTDLCVVGLGYIGLPTAVLAARAGLRVIGYDLDVQRVNAIQNNVIPDVEPELTKELKSVLEQGALTVQNTPATARFVMIAVPTPCTPAKQADISSVIHATHAIAPHITHGTTIIIESTVPVGTTCTMAELLETLTGLRVGIDFFVAFCPERVLPGNMLWELVHNARTIGGITRACSTQALTLYKQFVRAEMAETTAEAAELSKLIENSYRDVQIAFAHQVADMAKKLQIDPYELIAIANKHPRVNILRPTCGVGGHCIAVDPWFLIETFPQETELLKAARTINDARPKEIVKEIAEKYRACSQERPIILLGATYKPNIDDLRESPALRIAQELTHRFPDKVLVCEPHVAPEALIARGLAPITLHEALTTGSTLVALVAHEQFITSWDMIEMHSHLHDYCGARFLARTQRTLIANHRTTTLPTQAPIL